MIAGFHHRAFLGMASVILMTSLFAPHGELAIASPPHIRVRVLFRGICTRACVCMHVCSCAHSILAYRVCSP